MSVKLYLAKNLRLIDFGGKTHLLYLARRRSGFGLLALAGAVGRELLRLVFLVAIVLERAFQKLNDVFLDARVGVVVDLDVFASQELYNGRQGNVEIFCYFTYFDSRHVVVFVF